MDTFLLIAVLAGLVERLTEGIKKVLPVDTYGTIAAIVISWSFGILIALALGLDVFTASGYPVIIPILAQIITGFVIGAGSNLASDVRSYLNAVPARAPTVS